MAFGGGKSSSDGRMESHYIKALNEFRNVQIPSLRDIQYQIEPYEVDELLQHPLTLDVSDLQLAESALADIVVSPEVTSAQQDVLGRLEEVSQEGITAQERADLAKMRMDEKMTERGQREAILQQARERGIAGSGAELAAQLASQQSGADRGAQRGMDIAALAKQKALQALVSKGDLAGRMRGQEYQEKSEAARAADAIKQFNVAQQTSAREANIQREMEAAQQRQRIAEAQAQQETAQRAQAAEALKWRFGAEQQKAAGVSGQYGQAAQREAAESEAERQRKAQQQSAALAAAATIAASASDIRSKDNIEPVQPMDVNEFLNSLTPYKYDYKNPERHGEGRLGGLMAQDIERTEMGEGAVMEGPDGMKMVDNGKLVGALGASVAQIHERLKQLEQNKRGK